MYLSGTVADEIIDSAVKAAECGRELLSVLESLPAPIYVTDVEGTVTHFNQACIGFAGRTPTAGKDRWCVTWKLFTDQGEFLPHDQCPMAEAIRSRRPIRGLTAIAERPDGARVRFMPFPTPLFDKTNRFIGAVNMLIDVTDVRQIDELQTQAQRCRRLANGLMDKRAAQALTLMAVEYEAKAEVLARPDRMAG